MKDRTWKAAIWNLSWEDLAAGKYNVEGYCQFSANSGVHLDIPFGDLDLTRKLEENGLTSREDLKTKESLMLIIYTTYRSILQITLK